MAILEVYNLQKNFEKLSVLRDISFSLEEGQVLVILALTVVGILAILFLIWLAYSLVNQIYTFLFTIWNELVFRM